MTETPPIVPIPTSYVIQWSVVNGTALDQEENDEREVPDELYYEWSWKDIDISYSPKEYLGKVPVYNQSIKARVLGVVETETGVTYQLIPEYTINTLTIKSSHPTNNNWIFPDGNSEVDPNTPTEYGGCFLYDLEGPQRFTGDEYGTCGIKEGFVNWVDSKGNSRTSVSGYLYISVFEKSDFAYIPFNDSEVKTMSSRESFQFTPMHPDVEDPKGKKAPILPMNAITSFNPDGREEVTVTYTAKCTATVMGQVITSSVKVYQTCFQNTNDYGDILRDLLTYCNWTNTRGYKPDEFSYLYPYRYPYTYVQTEDPTKEENPERGDIWYNPVTQKRLYYTSGDIPQTFDVLDGGSLYKDRDNVQASWTVPRDENNLPLRKSEYHLDEDNLSHSLKVNIKTENGKVVSAVISDLGTPANFKDGDIVSVLGGNGDARLRVNISSPPGWTDTIVKKYGN